MARGFNTDVPFRDVFHHAADNAEQLRNRIVRDIDQCIANARYVDAHPRLNDGRRHLSPALYERLTSAYNPLLYHGALGLTNDLSDCLIWKWTEATGKYIGCPFWSQRAKALFDAASAGYVSSLNLRKAVNVGISLSRRSRPEDSRIAHEHVYPKRFLRRLLSDLKEDVRDVLDRLCVGCVVLQSEHVDIDRLGSPNIENPWMRYAPAGIKLADNPDWPPLQRGMIIEAGLLFA